MAENDTSDPSDTRLSAAQRVVRALTDDIATGVLKPGERLDEVRLAERLGVSRTPIREAFNQLIAQKILMSQSGRGVRVTELTREELSQMFEVMYEIEATCARLAAQRLTFLARSEIEQAQKACVAAAEAGDRIEYMRANETFHAAIYRATSNRFIEELASEFRRRTGPFRARRLQTKEDLIASAQSHQELLKDIFSADSEAAAEGMRTHMAISLMQSLGVN